MLRYDKPEVSYLKRKQVMTISKERLNRKLRHVEQDELQQVGKALLFVLEME